MRRALLVAAVAMTASCGPSRAPPHRVAVPPPVHRASPCEVAAELRGEADRLEHAGQLERVVSTVARAIATCPAEAAWGEAVKARAEASLHEPGDAAALFAQAVRARRRGESAAAQRGIDRARALFEASTGKTAGVVAGSLLARVTAFRFSDDGARLFFVRSDGGVFTLDTGSLRLERIARSLPGARHLDVAPGGVAFAVSTGDRVALGGHEPAPGVPIGFGGSGRWFAWQDGAVVRVSSAEGALSRSTALRSPPASVTLAPRGDALAITREDGAVDLWDVVGDRHLVIDAMKDAFALAFSADGKSLAVRKKPGYPGGVAIVDVEKQKVVHTLMGTRCDKSTAVAWSPDSRFVVVAGGSIEMCLWEVAGLRVRETFDLPLERRRGEPVPPIRLLAFTPNGAGLLAGASTGLAHEVSDVNLYRMPSAERISALGLRAWPRELDGGTLFLAGEDRPAVLVRPGLEVVDVHVHGLDKDVSRDGELAVAGNEVLATGTGQRVATLEEMKSGEVAVIGPRGDVIAGSSLGELRLWDAASGKLLVAGVSAVPVEQVELARGGESIVIAGAGVGRAWVWDLGGKPTDLAIARRRDGGIALSVASRPAATIYRFADAALVVSQSGAFETFGDAPAAERFVYCVVGASLYPSDLCLGRFDGRNVLGNAVQAAE